MTRRELFGTLAAAPLFAQQPKGSPVSIAKCDSYQQDITAVMSTMFDQLGGLERIVRNKTVTVKLNLTGSPALKFMGRPLGVTHYSHPKTVTSFAYLCSKAGAKRIRFVESCANTAGPMEEYLLDSGWNVRALKAVASNIEFENTNAIGLGKRYSRMKVPTGGLIFPAYDLNHSYEDTDVFVSMAKLKDHATCGITLSMKNMFGITPASIYGDDSGEKEPNESPTKGRVDTCHFAKRSPSKSAPQEIHPGASTDPGYRMPRITAELCAARPIDIAFIDGIETMAGGEGPWIKGVRLAKPGVLIAGLNPVSTDAVGAAVMGYDPRAPKGKVPFETCDNTLLLAESLGVGSADLSKIDVRGVAIKDAIYRFQT